MSEPEITFAQVRNIESVYRQRDWAFAQERAAEIDAHWASLRAQKPGLFDGRVLLMDAWRIEGDVFHTQHFSADFRAFVALRDFGFPDADVRNCFAAAALVSSDGAYVLGRMGAHTANAGRIYFPCGTPDMDDVRETVSGFSVDLEGSVLRELEEETGLRPDEVSVEPGWLLVFEGPRVACMKIVRSHLPADALIARIEDFLRNQKEPEFIALHVVRDLADLKPDAMPGFTRAFLTRMLSAPQPG
jgi:8-oxo-dGTP pyrophosphatase MutT (NUDIX family)